MAGAVGVRRNKPGGTGGGGEADGGAGGGRGWERVVVVVVCVAAEGNRPWLKRGRPEAGWLAHGAMPGNPCRRPKPRPSIHPHARSPPPNGSCAPPSAGKVRVRGRAAAAGAGRRSWAAGLRAAPDCRASPAPGPVPVPGGRPNQAATTAAAIVSNGAVACANGRLGGSLLRDGMRW